MLAQIIRRPSPVGPAPRTPLVIPSRIVPQNICPGLAQQIDVAKIKCEPASPVVSAGSPSFSDPRFRPIDRPTSLGEIFWIGEVPQIRVLPIEKLISEFVHSAGERHDERLWCFNLITRLQCFFVAS